MFPLLQTFSAIIIQSSALIKLARANNSIEISSSRLKDAKIIDL